MHKNRLSIPKPDFDFQENFKKILKEIALLYDKSHFAMQDIRLNYNEIDKIYQHKQIYDIVERLIQFAQLYYFIHGNFVIEEIKEEIKDLYEIKVEMPKHQYASFIESLENFIDISQFIKMVGANKIRNKYYKNIDIINYIRICRHQEAFIMINEQNEINNQNPAWFKQYIEYRTNPLKNFFREIWQNNHIGMSEKTIFIMSKPKNLIILQRITDINQNQDLDYSYDFLEVIKTHYNNDIELIKEFISYVIIYYFNVGKITTNKMVDLIETICDVEKFNENLDSLIALTKDFNYQKEIKFF